MTAFLSWVYSQAQKIYDWFGSAYYTLKNAAANAWNWAAARAAEALAAARSYAYNLLAQAQASISSSINWLKVYVANIRTGIYEEIRSLTDWVEWKLSQVGTFAVDVFWSAVDNALSFIQSVRDDLTNLISSSIQWVFDKVSNTYSWLIGLRDKLIGLVSFFTTDRLNSLLGFFTNGLSALTTFIQNPLVFILDVIRDKFISFLCYVLAHALGTTKYDLPNQPTWKDR